MSPYDYAPVKLVLFTAYVAALPDRIKGVQRKNNKY